MRRREREKTIRLAIILLAVVAIIAIAVPDQTKGQVTIDQACETEILTEESNQEDDTTILGLIVLSGIVAFEVVTFLWILKKEKQGYKFSIE